MFLEVWGLWVSRLGQERRQLAVIKSGFKRLGQDAQQGSGFGALVRGSESLGSGF